MNINLLKPAAAKRIPKFNDNVIYFFVCFPLVLSCLRRRRQEMRVYQLENITTKLKFKLNTKEK